MIPGQKIKMGPLWDFDLAFGNTDYADTSIMRVGGLNIIHGMNVSLKTQHLLRWLKLALIILKIMKSILFR